MLTAQIRATHTDPAALLDAHPKFLMAARALYAPHVIWCAPARGVERVGREEVIRHVLREASGMHEPEFTFIRRHAAERQIIDEFAVRFVAAPDGFINAPIDPGDFIELKRVRILELNAGRITKETCIENWTVLLPAQAARAL